QGHPLTGKRIASLRELAHESWIAPLRGTPARKAFERAFAAEGIAAPQGSLEANSAAVLQSLLLDSDRLALLSRRQIVRGMAAGLLTVLPVPVKETARHIGLAMRADSEPGPIMRTFMEEIRRLAPY